MPMLYVLWKLEYFRLLEEVLLDRKTWYINKINMVWMVRKKMNLSMCSTNLALCHENIWGMDVWIRIFLATELVEGEWSASCSCSFTPEQYILIIL